MTTSYDVIIIGAGPSGTACAITLSKNTALKILIADKADFPRDKVCGDGLTGDSLRCLKKLSLYDRVLSAGHRTNSIDMHPFCDSRHFTLESEIITLKRREFDNILLNEALGKSNITFEQLLFRGACSFKDNTYEVEFESGDDKRKKVYASKHLIIATGCQNDNYLNSMSGMPLSGKPDLIAYRGYLYSSWNITAPKVLFLSKYMNGYFWIFPMGGNLFNVGCGSKNSFKNSSMLKEILARYLEHFDKEFKTSSQWETAPRAAFLRTGLNLNRLNSDNGIIFAGETVSTTYPFTGEGIGKALESGILAGEAVLKSCEQSDLKASELYRNMIKNKLLPYYKPYKTADLIFRNNFLSSASFRLILKSRRVKQNISDILSEKHYPKKFSMRGTFLKLLLSGHKP